MRYTRVGVASYAIASVLVVTVLGVAWARSRAPSPPTPPTASTEAPATAPSGAAAPAPGAAPAPQDSGAAAWEAECGACHRDGEARGRSIPALRGLAVTLFTSRGGREYLIDLMLDGRVRSVENGRTEYVESHPSYEELSDASIAAILNHMLESWGNQELLPAEPPLYTAAAVAARRAGP